MTDHEQLYLDDALRNADSRSTEHFLIASLPFDSVLGSGARPDGIARSFAEGPIGDSVVSLALFQPGIDTGLTIDIAASLAGKEPKARRKDTLASPNQIHVVVDEPDRTQLFTGDFSYRNIADFTVALCGRVALATGTKLNVYHNDGNRAGLVFAGSGDDIHDAFAEMHRTTRRKPIERAKSPTTTSTLELAHSIAHPENDALVVVSDFLDDYDAQTHTFGWENTVRHAVHDMDDRFRAIRVLSPAQIAMPAGLYDVLSPISLEAITTSYRNIAEFKDEKIIDSLSKTRLLELDLFKKLNDTHPAESLARFIVGASLE